MGAAGCSVRARGSPTATPAALVALACACAPPGAVGAAAVAGWYDKLWPVAPGVPVRYAIATDVPAPTPHWNASAVGAGAGAADAVAPLTADDPRIRNALSRWEHATCVRFALCNEGGVPAIAAAAASADRGVEQNACTPPYIRFEAHPTKCAAPSGMVASSTADALRGTAHAANTIRVSPSCDERGLLHEVGHVLGLAHEHARWDRDRYVAVQTDEIRPEARYNFDIPVPAEGGRRSRHDRIADALRTHHALLTPYDYASIMHYGAFAFAKANKPTLIAPQPIGGPRRGVSVADARGVNFMYQQCRAVLPRPMCTASLPTTDADGPGGASSGPRRVRPGETIDVEVHAVFHRRLAYDVSVRPDPAGVDVGRSATGMSDIASGPPPPHTLATTVLHAGRVVRGGRAREGAGGNATGWHTGLHVTYTTTPGDAGRRLQVVVVFAAGESSGSGVPGIPIPGGADCAVVVALEVLAAAADEVQRDLALTTRAHNHMSFHAASGTVADGYYPGGRYALGVLQTLTVRGGGAPCMLNWTRLDVEAAPGCAYDYVEVKDGAASLGKFCGSETPAPMRVSGAGFTVVFVSDRFGAGEGYEFAFACGGAGGGVPSAPPPAAIASPTPAPTPKRSGARMAADRDPSVAFGGINSEPVPAPWQVGAGLCGLLAAWWVRGRRRAPCSRRCW